MDASEDSVIGVSIDLAHTDGKLSIERPVALNLPFVTVSAGHKVGTASRPYSNSLLSV
jgi:hypothetical protein